MADVYRRRTVTYWTTATTPTVTDDYAAGFRLGDRWVVISTAATYTLTDDTAGAAVWTEEDGTGGGGGTDHATLTNRNWTVAAHTATGTTYPALAGWSAASTPTYYHIGTDVQAWDADLDAIAALGTTGYAQRTGANTWALVAATAILDDVLTTKGDILSYTTTPARVAVGTDDYSIVADSTATPGWRWYKRRLTQVVTTTASYVAVSLPTDCTYVAIRCVNGGASGGNGTSGTTAAVRRGGGGGGGGAEHEITYLRSQLPDTIYAFVAPSSTGNGNLSWVAMTDTGISTDPIVQPNAGYLLAGGGGLASAGTSAGAAGSGGTATTIDTSSPWCRSCVSQRTIAGGNGQASSATGTPAGRDPWAAANGSGITEGGLGGGTNNTGAVAGSAGGGFNAKGPFSAVAGGTAGTGADGGAGTAGTYGGGAAGGATSTSSDPGELSWAHGGTGGGSAVTGNGGNGGDGAPGCGGGGGGAATGTAGTRGSGGQGYVVVDCF